MSCVRANRVLGVLCTLLIVAASHPGISQTVTTGEVTGSAFDATGAVVTQASVVLKSLDTGESRTVVTSSAGLYRFTFVRPGSYELSASSAGEKSAPVRVAVALGQVKTVDVVLKIEEARQSVVVTGSSPLLETENAQSSYNLTERQMETLPLRGGDLTGVAYSAPGAVIANRYGTNGTFVFQGIGGVSNLYTVNGADDMDPHWNLNNSGVSLMLLGANEVQEASVIQSTYEGQYGRQAGAQLNYVTKSGTNKFHGNLVYNYNGSVLNANDYFSNARGIKRPKAVSNQYAASFGGPILRNKLFFFVDTEGLRYTKPVSSPTIALPSKALEQYILRTVQPSQVPLYQQAFSIYDAAPGRSQAVPVTTGTGPLQDSSRRLGCGSLAGTPTGVGGTFGTDVSCADAYPAVIHVNIPEWIASARVDYNLGARQRFFVRFKVDHGVKPNPNALNPVFDITSNQPNYETQFNHTFAISNRLANNFTGAFNYYNYVSTFADAAGAVKAFPLRFNFNDGGANAGKIASLGAAAGNPQGHRTANAQLADDVSYSRGRHFLKAGVNYRYSRQADFQYSRFTQIARYDFGSLKDFASGTLSSRSFYLQNFPNTPIVHLGFYNLGFYLQDEWAATSHLKLTATARFDRSANPDCLDRCFARLIAPFDQIAKGASIPYNQSIEAGLSHPFYSVDPIEFQPRFSFAYSPKWAKGTVLRGGVGMFFDQYPLFFANTLAGLPPNNFTALIRTGLVNTGGAGSAAATASASASAFNSGFAGGATLTTLQKAVAPAGFTPPYFYSVPSTLHLPAFTKWSLEVQHQVGQKNVASISYEGNHGYNLFLQKQMDLSSETGFGGLPKTPPDPRFVQVDQLTNNGYSNYDGMTVDFRHAFGSGLQGHISYRWSHALDTLSNGGLLFFGYYDSIYQIDPLNSHHLSYGNADYDVTHNLTFDFVWEVPARVHNRALRAIVGGWTIADKTNLYTGTPFSVFDSALGYPTLADVIDPKVRISCGHANIKTPCFTPSQFASPDVQNDFGNVSRNHFRGPGYFDADTSIYKTIAIRERARFTFGATAYNVFNHPNFVDPNQDVTDSGLGLITSTGTPPSGAYGLYGGPSGRSVVITGRLTF